MTTRTAGKEESLVADLLAKAGIEIGGGNPWDLQVHDGRFFKAVLGNGTLGVGESYMEGWWDSGALDETTNRVLQAHLEDKLEPLKMVFQVLLAKSINMQNKLFSKRVAEQHYDLGNDFYAKMLDSRMQYTCAYWQQATDLETAQERKLDLVCRKLQLKPGDRVLELGCGWGGFAKFAAERYGCSVRGYNISKEQVARAREKSRGLDVEIVLADYRDAEGTYDKVVSIGLGEHVGYKNYRGLFELVHRSLVDEGLFLFHSIGSNHTRVITDPWLDKYVFPGSLLPSTKQLGAAMDDLLVLEDWHNFGPYYDQTLMAWWEKFNRAWPEVRGGRFDERFYRMWKYYLLTSAGTFRSRKNQLWQIVLSKNGVKGGYASIR